MIISQLICEMSSSCHVLNYYLVFFLLSSFLFYSIFTSCFYSWFLISPNVAYKAFSFWPKTCPNQQAKLMAQQRCTGPVSWPISLPRARRAMPPYTTCMFLISAMHNVKATTVLASHKLLWSLYLFLVQDAKELNTKGENSMMSWCSTETQGLAFFGTTWMEPKYDKFMMGAIN